MSVGESGVSSSGAYNDGGAVFCGGWGVEALEGWGGDLGSPLDLFAAGGDGFFEIGGFYGAGDWSVV